MTELKKVPVKVAAAILGKSEQFVRCGLRYGNLNFGVAVSSNPHKRNFSNGKNIRSGVVDDGFKRGGKQSADKFGATHG